MATGALAAQQRPTEDGDVLICADGTLAVGAAGRRRDYRHPSRPAGDADVQERSDARAYEERTDAREERCHGLDTQDIQCYPCRYSDVERLNGAYGQRDCPGGAIRESGGYTGPFITDSYGKTS